MCKMQNMPNPYNVRASRVNVEEKKKKQEEHEKIMPLTQDRRFPCPRLTQMQPNKSLYLQRPMPVCHRALFLQSLHLPSLG
jgi:hypothetical protein